MQIKRFGTGPINTNTYVVSDGGEAAIIDPAAFPHDLEYYITLNRLSVKYILLTHAHFDHTMGAQAIKEYYKAKVLMGEGDADMINEPLNNGCNKWNIPHIKTEADSLLRDGDEIKLGDITFRVIATPGHSKGGVCYYCASENTLFAGDTLFCGSVGRTDLYGGSSESLRRSVTEKLYVLPDETEVFSGHGEMSSIGDEKENNDFIRA